MLEHEFHHSQLIAGHLQGSLSQSEEEELSSWLAEDPANQTFYESFLRDEHLAGELKYYFSFDRETLWNDLQSQLHAAKADAPKSAVRLWPRIAVAAVAVVAIVFGAWFYISHDAQKSKAVSDFYASDIEPGKNKATLTLANGKVINLSDAKSGVIMGEQLSYNDNTPVISKTNRFLPDSQDDVREMDQMRLSTPPGGTYQVILSDGTKVWLNAASSLTYTNKLNKDGQRRVRLEGEAYFEVYKDKAHPFIVQTADQEIEVLGTHFNVNSYPDEQQGATTLLEGSVKVISGSAIKVIRPGEQALNKSGELTVRAVNVDHVIDWKNDGFAFNGEDFSASMRKISRWYNVEFVYDPAVVRDIEIGGFISRKNKLSAVLKFIESTREVHFKTEGRRIIVEK